MQQRIELGTTGMQIDQVSVQANLPAERQRIQLYILKVTGILHHVWITGG
jgi:hypothetical protein